MKSAHLYLILGLPSVLLLGWARTLLTIRHSLAPDLQHENEVVITNSMQCRIMMTHLPRVADDTEVPVVIFVDRDHNKILLENVDFPGPPLYSVMSRTPRISRMLRMIDEVIGTYLLTTGSFLASMGLGFCESLEYQKVVKMCVLKIIMN